MDKKTLLCIKSKNSFHHFLKYTLIVFYISILSCVKLLENYMILSWHLDYRCEEWITCIFQNLFQCVCETFLKTLLGCPFGGTCLQPVCEYPPYWKFRFAYFPLEIHATSNFMWTISFLQSTKAQNMIWISFKLKNFENMNWILCELRKLKKKN